MPDEYALDDAKAKVSDLVREVQQGRTVIITLNGKPVAELRPIDVALRTQTLDDRLAELQSRRAITNVRRQPRDAGAFPIGARRRGALKRFLKERD
jgi:prevent-host-death family protein